MLRRSNVALYHGENWRGHYHRINIPRREALKRYREKLERTKAANAAAGITTADQTQSARVRQEFQPEQPYKYNRWWVNNDLEFVHQHAVVEDPVVAAERRERLPKTATEADWKKPHKPTFDHLLPFVKVVDYPKDPDAKSATPVNVPRWKDYMLRKDPVVPRTWY